jgi:hypothetical protein
MRYAHLVLLLALLLTAAPARGADLLEADRQALLFLKTLSFNKALKQTEEGTIRVAVISKTGVATGSCAEFAASLAVAIKTLKVSGASVEILQVASENAAELEKKLTAGAGGAYVCNEIVEKVPAIVVLTRKAGVLSFAPTEEQVKAGVSIGLVSRESKATIVVNLASIRAEGADLAPAFLRLAEAIQ